MLCSGGSVGREVARRVSASGKAPVGGLVADDLVGDEGKLCVREPALEALEPIAGLNPAAEVERRIELVGELDHRDNDVLERRGPETRVGGAAQVIVEEPVA